MEPRQCEGSCETHRGEVARYHVSKGLTDWGWYWYCEEAVAEDKRRGMTVETEEEIECQELTGLL